MVAQSGVNGRCADRRIAARSKLAPTGKYGQIVGASLLAMTAMNSPKVKSETHHPRVSTNNQEGAANGLLDF